MRGMALAAAVTAAVGFGATPNPHPHAIVSAADAVETARVIWNERYPTSGAGNRAEWERQFKGAWDGKVWTVRQITSGPDDQSGTIIYLDPKDGHIISAQIID